METQLPRANVATYNPLLRERGHFALRRMARPAAGVLRHNDNKKGS
jgi:hypothetical protein